MCWFRAGARRRELWLWYATQVRNGNQTIFFFSFSIASSFSSLPLITVWLWLTWYTGCPNLLQLRKFHFFQKFVWLNSTFFFSFLQRLFEMRSNFQCSDLIWFCRFWGFSITFCWIYSTQLHGFTGQSNFFQRMTIPTNNWASLKHR